MEGPFEVLDFSIGILFGFGEVVDLFLVMLGHLIVVSLLRLEFSFEVDDSLVCIEVLSVEGFGLFSFSVMDFCELFYLFVQHVDSAIKLRLLFSGFL